jgi:hypothetical protein
MTIFKYDPSLTGPMANRIHARGEALVNGQGAGFFAALIPFAEDVDEAAIAALIAKDSKDWKTNLAARYGDEVTVANVQYRLASGPALDEWHPIEVTL